jgi:L-threonylcarbamoyladenylate synthase
MHVRDDLDGRIPLILDAGVTPMGLESTIVDMRDVPTLLRAGAVEREAIEAVLGTSLTSIDRTPLSPVAPGQLASHYAPSTPVRLDILPSDVRTGEVYLGFGEHHLDGQPNLSPAGDVAEAAHALYSALRDADRKDMQGIAIAPIPSKGLGEAIQDRLKRAATPP